MTDQARFIAFLDGCQLPYKVEAKADVMLLPTDAEDIAYITYATRVGGFGFVDVYFKDDGSLAALARPAPLDRPQACAEYIPNNTYALEVCATCGCDRGQH